MISCLLALATAGLLLCGCGGQSNTVDEQESVQTDGTEVADADPAVDDGIVHLKFWCDEDEMSLFQEMINNFIEEHKSEATIEVEYEVVPASSCKDTFLGDVNNGADVFSMPDDQLLTMVVAGILEPIANEDDIRSRNQEGSIEASSVDGRIYAYPVTADNGFYLYYDKQYFTDEDVKTLDRILEVCGENGKTFAMDWSSGWYLFAFFGNTGLELGLNDDGLTNYCNWNSTENAIKGVDVAQALLDISANPAFSGRSDTLAAAQSGEAIAFVSGVWDILAVKEAYGEDYGACKLPTFTCAGQQIQMSSFKGYRLLGVNSYSENRDWAEKLADYLTNEENQNLRFARAERGPSNINAAASDAIQKVPAIAAVLEQSEYAVLQKVGPNFWTPMSEFGTTMKEGNPRGLALQDIMDSLVSEITAQ